MHERDGGDVAPASPPSVSEEYHVPVVLSARLEPGRILFEPSTLDYVVERPQIGDHAGGPLPMEPGRPSWTGGFSLDRWMLPQDPPVRRLMVANTVACNMSCAYCYNELPGKELNTTLSGAHTNPDALRERLVRFVAGAEPRQQVGITFIGGEPLMAQGVLTSLVAQLRRLADDGGIPLDLGVYTNGLTMDAKCVDWAVENGVSLIVSLDGPPLEHDLRRRDRAGHGTGRRILRNVRYLMSQPSMLTRRVRAVSGPEPACDVLHRYLAALGFNEVHVQRAYGLPADVAPQPSDSDDDPDGDLAVARWYLASLLSGTVLDVAPFSADLIRMALRGRAVQNHLPCDAGIFAVALDDRGDCYPCHHFFGEPDHRYPDPGPGSLPTADSRRPRYLPVHRRPGCADCWARHLCGGTCYHRAATAHGDYFGRVDADCARVQRRAPMIVEMFDTLLRTEAMALTSLIAGQLSVPTPVEAAYECESLAEFAADVLDGEGPA